MDTSIIWNLPLDIYRSTRLISISVFRLTQPRISLKREKIITTWLSLSVSNVLSYSSVAFVSTGYRSASCVFIVRVWYYLLSLTLAINLCNDTTDVNDDVLVVRMTYKVIKALAAVSVHIHLFETCIVYCRCMYTFPDTIKHRSITFVFIN